MFHRQKVLKNSVGNWYFGGGGGGDKNTKNEEKLLKTGN